MRGGAGPRHRARSIVPSGTDTPSGGCRASAREPAWPPRSGWPAASPRSAARSTSGWPRRWCTRCRTPFVPSRQGRCSEWRATLLVRETACLSAADRRAVDADLMADPDRCDGWGDRRLAAEARKAAYRLDPHAVVARARRAVEERHVSVRPAPDTMTYLSALLPVAQGVACYASLQREADRLRSTGDTRGRGQLMADTLVARLTGATAEAAAPPAVPVAINLTVSDATLLGGGHEPAWITGYGPVPAGTRPRPGRHRDRGAHATLRRLYVTDGGCPGPWTPGPAPSRRRSPCFIDLRDQTCRTPWCDAPVRHHDHVVPAADGGPTSEANGARPLRGLQPGQGGPRLAGHGSSAARGPARTSWRSPPPAGTGTDPERQRCQHRCTPRPGNRPASRSTIDPTSTCASRSPAESYPLALREADAPSTPSG